MVQKLKDMHFGTAKYVVMKELDERGPIGQLLISYDPNFANNMMNVCEWVDKTQITLEEQQNNRNPQIDYGYLEDAVRLLNSMSEKFPFLMLVASQLDWETFLSGWLTITNEIAQISGFLAEQNDDPRLCDMCRQCSDSLMAILAPTCQLIELGIGYQELLQASAEIVKELQGWRQSQPSAIRLSHAYLRSLGMIPEEKGAKHEPESLNEIMPPPHNEPSHCEPGEMPPPPHHEEEIHPPIFIGRE